MAALLLGHPLAIGNDLADREARRAACTTSSEEWSDAPAAFSDAVWLVDATGAPVLTLRPAVVAAFWAKWRSGRSVARPWLEALYPVDCEIDWPSSVGIFRRPMVRHGKFHHAVPPATVKWMARMRAGCLASRRRLFTRSLVVSPACPCCGATEEDELHMVAGCSATGSLHWAALLSEAWAVASRQLGGLFPPPPAEWLSAHQIPLLAALIPRSLDAVPSMPRELVGRFKPLFHREVALRMAEIFRRRGELVAQAEPCPSGEGAVERVLGAEQPVGVPLPCPLPRERQLAVGTLVQVEQERRLAAEAQPPEAPLGLVVPDSGHARQVWMRQQLTLVIQSQMTPCPAAAGSLALAFLALFERHTGQVFADTPGVPVGSRVRGMARMLPALAQQVEFVPPLLSASRHGWVYWNRSPRVALDAVAWRRLVEEGEASAAPVARLHGQMATAARGLAAWVRGHPSLLPAVVEAGESGMALLLLWEVDHGKAYPSRGSGGASFALQAFARQLRLAVAKDAELSMWLTVKDMHRPLSPGLAPSHHQRWSLRIQPPGVGEDRRWYEDFLGRWHAYLSTLVGHVPSSRSTSGVSVVPDSGAMPDSAPPSAASITTARPRVPRAACKRHLSMAPEPAVEEEPPRGRLRLAGGLDVHGLDTRVGTPQAVGVGSEASSSAADIARARGAGRCLPPRGEKRGRATVPSSGMAQGGSHGPVMGSSSVPSGGRDAMGRRPMGGAEAEVRPAKRPIRGQMDLRSWLGGANSRGAGPPPKPAEGPGRAPGPPT